LYCAHLYTMLSISCLYVTHTHPNSHYTLSLHDALPILANVPLKQGALITDVGSTKEAIVNKATILNGKNVTFIGGHPMAGSHKTGVGSAKAHLFENAFYILTPTPETKPERVSEL